MKYLITIEADSENAVLRAVCKLHAAFTDYSGPQDAPYRISVECDGVVSALAKCDEAMERQVSELGLSGTKRYDWIPHDGGECPVHPRDVVEFKQRLTGECFYVRPAGELIWIVITYYRPLRDEDGIPYVYNDGSLEDWAEYVAMDKNGSPHCYSDRPISILEHGEWMDWGVWIGQGKVRELSNHYKNTHDHWTETLRRVWRG